MIAAKIRVNGTYANTIWANAITAGMVGAQIRIDYGPEWDGLTKTVVFRGSAAKDVITDAADVDIPAECVAVAGAQLDVGIYGIRGQELAIPTLWANLGRVQRSADPSGDTSTDPSLPVWAQIQAMIGDLDKLDTKAKSDLVAAVNEALTKGGGTVDAETVRQIVADYLAENPPAPGEPGDDGGYYTPSVSQLDDNTMTVSFAASKDGMEEVPDKNITLPPGETGKSAYQYAVDGGYTGTEAAFAEKMAAEIPDPATVILIDDISSTQANLTPAEILTAVVAGKVLMAIGGVCTLMQYADDGSWVTLHRQYNEIGKVAEIKINADKSYSFTLHTLVADTTSLPNPHALTINGTSYDGSAPVDLAIDGGSGIAVTGATVGQTIRVASVDDDGVPTAWEPVDMPDGGGGGEVWELLDTVTMEVDTNYALVTLPCKVKKLFVYTLSSSSPLLQSSAVIRLATSKYGYNNQYFGESANFGTSTWVGLWVLIDFTISNKPVCCTWSGVGTLVSGAYAQFCGSYNGSMTPDNFYITTANGATLFNSSTWYIWGVKA